jgi:cytochrome c biogenesis protein CcmG/thiol:disulfide interchange protein DsbE
VIAVAGTSTIAAPEGRRRRPVARWAALGAGVVVALLVAVLATREPSRFRLADSPLLGREAPAVAGRSLIDGTPFDLRDERGRFVLVNFFATWCIPCREEHPDLVRFAAAHRDDARVVSVVFSDEPDDVERFFAERGGGWPVVDDGLGRVIADWGVTGVPESYLVGPEGGVRAKIVGGVDAERLDDLLRRARAGPDAGAEE